MKKVLLDIHPSPLKNYKFKVYRDINREGLPADTNTLLEKTPIMIINEKEIGTKKAYIEDREIFMCPNTAAQGDFIPYAIPYPLAKGQSAITLSFKYDNPVTYDEYNIRFDENRVITLVKDAQGVEYNGSEYFQIIGETVIGINKKILDKLVRLRCDYGTDVIEVSDIEDSQVGVVYNGPLPDIGIPVDGKIRFEREYREGSDEMENGYRHTSYVRNRTQIPEKTLYYRVIAIDEDNKVSDPSELMYVKIPKNIYSNEREKYVVQFCSNYYDSEDYDTSHSNTFENETDKFNKAYPLNKWIDTEITMRPGGKEEYIEDFIYPGPKPTPYDTISAECVNGDEPHLKLKFFNPIAYYIFDGLERCMIIASRLKAYYVETGEVLGYSDIEYRKDDSGSIDKVLVRRKEINESSSNTPCSIDGPDADTVALFVKKTNETGNGIEYEKILTEHPEWIDEKLENTRVFETGMNVAVINPKSYIHTDLTKEVTVIDKNVVEGRRYRYTIYNTDIHTLTSEGCSFDVTFNPTT